MVIEVEVPTFQQLLLQGSAVWTEWMDRCIVLGYTAKTMKNALGDISKWLRFVCYRVLELDSIPDRYPYLCFCLPSLFVTYRCTLLLYLVVSCITWIAVARS